MILAYVTVPCSKLPTGPGKASPRCVNIYPLSRHLISLFQQRLNFQTTDTKIVVHMTRDQTVRCLSISSHRISFFQQRLSSDYRHENSWPRDSRPDRSLHGLDDSECYVILNLFVIFLDIYSNILTRAKLKKLLFGWFNSDIAYVHFLSPRSVFTVACHVHA
jgi:hypothetical protein